MTRSGTPGRGIGPAVALAVLAGVVVLVVLFPGSGVDSLPPRCFAFVGYEVPCAGAVAPLAGAGTAVLVFVALRLVGRRA
jgi:hypothetical protein